MTESHALILQKSLASLPGEVQNLLKNHRFSEEWLLRQVELSRSGTRKNQVDGKVTPLLPTDMSATPEPGSDAYRHYHARGEAALRNGECALAVLAGGMATRMGGVIKALVPAAHEKTFLELRLGEQESLANKYGRTPPLWLMTSYATHQGIESALGARLESDNLALFRQGLSVRLNEKGEVFWESTGEPSLYSPGHGDFVECLQNSGLLQNFIDAGGKYVLATNLDNLGGGLDPVIIGMHLESECAVTCEVVNKDDGDRGGIPARLDGKPVILEEFRLPETFDPSQVSVFNVNTFAFDARALASLSMDFTYFEVKKQVEGATAIQYERLINEVTFHLPTLYARVPRTGTESRFLPVKDYEELARRQADLDALALARGMVAQQ